MRLSKAKIDELREQYLALTDDQERADFLWAFGHGGAVLGLTPDQYPKSQPRHKPCKYCGGTGKPKRITVNTNSVYDWVIQCTTCGRMTDRAWSIVTGWRMWDNGEVPDGEQMNLFDLMEAK